MKTMILLMTIVLCLCLGFNQTQAEIITIEITGEVTFTHGTGVPDTIHAGDTFAGTYTYDSATNASGPSHHIHDAPYGISISIGGYEFKTAPDHVGQFDMWIINDDPVNGPMDYYIVRSNENISVPSISGLTLGSIRWDLRDSTYDALSSSALPIIAPVLTDWDYNFFKIYGFGDLGFSIEGTVTKAVLIPEPLTGIFIAMGVLLLRRR
jgi:hypothetical protein